MSNFGPSRRHAAGTFWEEIMQFIKGLAAHRFSNNRNASRPILEPLDPRLLLSATFTVNTLIDDSTPEDGVLSLREAVEKANTTAGADIIAFSTGLTGTIKLTNGQLDILDDLTINGPGARVLSVSGDFSSRVFHIDDFKVAIANLSIIDGQANQEDDGGGIFNAGHLTLNRVLLSDNEAGFGGNSFFEDPAPDGGRGGAIYNSGVLTISNSAILDNFGGQGGTGYDDFSAGGAGGEGGYGGGIYNNGTLLLTNSTVAGNEAGLGGFGGDSDFGFGGDAGDGGWGGGIANNGDATLINVTVSDNYSGFGGFGGQNGGRRGRYGAGGGIYNRGDASFTIANSLIADNDIGADYPDASGDFKSLGHNLVTASDGSQGWLASDFVGSNNAPIDAKLDFLDYHGGPTPTISLLAGSPAIDKADKALLSTYALTTDQRGYARVYNRLPDIGSFEASSGYPADANHDGSIDFNDLVKLAQNYNISDGNRTWEQGDFTGDGNVDFNDLVVLAQNYNTTPGAPASASAAAVTAPAVSATQLLASITTTKKKKPDKPIFSVVKVTKPAKPAPPARGKH
jgi:hypothetical protein